MSYNATRVPYIVLNYVVLNKPKGKYYVRDLHY